MSHYIGIDNSSLDHKVQVLDASGNKKSSFTIPNNLEGFEVLHQRLKEFTDVKIAFESPHEPLVDFLRNKKYSLYSLNPLKVKRYKESVKVSGDKNDTIDALAIAEYLKHNASYTRELFYNSPQVERLKHLASIHTRLVQARTAHLNRLHHAVRRYFPLHEQLFSVFGGPVQLKMLEKYPTFKDLHAASDEELREFMKSCNYRHYKYMERIIQKIRAYNQFIDPDVEYAFFFEAQTLCKILHVLKEQLDTIEKEMNDITDAHHLGPIFKSLPGAGPILASKLLALFGDNKNRFENFNNAQCYFGTAPKNYKSGTYHRVNMRKACNKAGRLALYHHAFATLKTSEWARKYYDSQRASGKTNSMALRALSNKWVKIIFKLWKEEIFYDESKKTSSAA